MIGVDPRISRCDGAGCSRRCLAHRVAPYEPVEHIHLFTSGSLRAVLDRTGLEDITEAAHWKRLPIDYVIQMLRNFGPEIGKLVGPVYRRLPGALTRRSLPFYVGEMIVSARRPARLQ